MNISTGPTRRWIIGGGILLLAALLGVFVWQRYLPSYQQVAAQCGSAPMGFVTLPGGSFEMGSDDFYPEERPLRRAETHGFAIRTTEVTNREFAAFVEATGYVTVAERPAPETGAPGSAVFIAPDRNEPLRPMSWWHWIEGADWRHPEGPGSSIEARMDHPVVQMAYEDAVAYAAWEGSRLPTEEEWEYAASAGGTVSDTPYRATPRGPVPIANTWQGVFPLFNSDEDGFVRTAPVGCFEPNDFALYDMIGNVWEWTATPGGESTGTIKGGSFLCAPNYCMRYRPAAREAQETGLGTNHIGFRTVRDMES